jgi:multidrug efflux pump subunit AcrB
MRIWLNRDQLAAHNITVADVEEEESEYMEFPVK